MIKLLEDSGNAWDETRLLQEVAVYSEKTDYTEELTRFESHLNQFAAALDSTEPIGRKLDFLLQEINREINTTASKANDISVIDCVIIIKTELRKSGNRFKISNKEIIMGVQLINIGFGNMAAATRVIAIISPESAPVKRMIQDCRDKGELIDATYGRKTRAVLIMDSGQTILSAVQPETISHRLMNKETAIMEAADEG